MASDGQQYNEQNFAEDQQYNDYSEQNYSEAMEEGGGSGDQNQAMNGDDGPVPPKVSTDEDKKIFIGGISWDTDQKDLKEYFSKFGEVADVTIKTDPTTGKSRGFAFITFGNEESVDNVLKNCPHTIKGKQIDAKRAKVRPGIKKIFVGGLDNDIPEADIRSYFEKYGKVESVELPFDKVKNQRRAFCFVTFETEDACEAACKQSKQKIGNKECDVKKATNKPDPRMGGRGGPGGSWGGGFAGRGGGRGRGARGRGGPGFPQPQGWSAPGNYAGGYGGQGYGGYNQGYGSGGYGGGYGNYGDYGYGGSYGSNYGSGYDYSGWNYGQGGNYSGTGGYGQQPSNYGKTARRGAATGASTNAYHPYSR